MGGITPSPALTGNPDIGQYVATVCSARTAAVSRKLEDHWWAETLQLQDVDHSTILSLLGSVSIHVSDVSLGNAANVSVGDRVPQDTNNVLCWRVLAQCCSAGGSS